MKLYEVPFIIASDVPPHAVDAVARRFAGVVSKDAGKIHKFEYVGVRDFAYKIGKFSSGRYYVLYIEMDPSSVEELTSYLRTNEGVIRYAFYSIDSIPESKSWLAGNVTDSEFSSPFTSLLAN